MGAAPPSRSNRVIASKPSANGRIARDEIGERDMMLDGVSMLAATFGILAFIWIMVLWGSRGFGSPPEH
jgi:hypothetical protein